jgi:hypothetical protein
MAKAVERRIGISYSFVMNNNIKEKPMKNKKATKGKKNIYFNILLKWG